MLEGKYDVITLHNGIRDWLHASFLYTLCIKLELFILLQGGAQFLQMSTIVIVVLKAV